MHTKHSCAIDQLQSSIADLKVFKKAELKELFIKYRKWFDNKSNCGAKIRKEGKEAHELIVLHNLKLVVKLAHQYKFGIEPEDLINEGTIGLLTAIEKFDVNNGAKFSTYASLWIKNHIRRCLSNKSRTIRVPTHVAEKIGKILDYVNKYKSDNNDEMPSLSKIRDNVKGISKTILNDLINGGVLNLTSVDMTIGDGEGKDSTFGDVVEDKKIAAPDKNGEYLDNIKHLTFYLDKLKGREKHIIRRRFGLGGKRPETLEDIAKSYGVSRERIRQIQTKAMRKLRRAMGQQYGENFFIPLRQF